MKTQSSRLTMLGSTKERKRYLSTSAKKKLEIENATPIFILVFLSFFKLNTCANITRTTALKMEILEMHKEPGNEDGEEWKKRRKGREE